MDHVDLFFWSFSACPVRALADERVCWVDRPTRVSSLAGQWRYFRAHYPLHVLLVQVCKHWEYQEPNDGLIKDAFALCRRSGLACQLPRRCLGHKCRRGQPRCDVCENGLIRGR